MSQQQAYWPLRNTEPSLKLRIVTLECYPRFHSPFPWGRSAIFVSRKVPLIERERKKRQADIRRGERVDKIEETGSEKWTKVSRGEAKGAARPPVITLHFTWLILVQPIHSYFFLLSADQVARCLWDHPWKNIAAGRGPRMTYFASLPIFNGCCSRTKYWSLAHYGGF